MTLQEMKTLNASVLALKRLNDRNDKLAREREEWKDYVSKHIPRWLRKFADELNATIKVSSLTSERGAIIQIDDIHIYAVPGKATNLWEMIFESDILLRMDTEKIPDLKKHDYVCTTTVKSVADIGSIIDFMGEDD